MRRRKRSWLYLLTAAISLIATLLIIFFLSPSEKIQLGFLSVSPLVLFLAPLLLFFFSLPTFFLKSPKHGILLSLFVLLYMIFRVNNLTHPIFLFILLGIFLTLELFFSNRQSH
jgi:hypothetical protein